MERLHLTLHIHIYNQNRGHLLGIGFPTLTRYGTTFRTCISRGEYTGFNKNILQPGPHMTDHSFRLSVSNVYHRRLGSATVSRKGTASKHRFKKQIGLPLDRWLYTLMGATHIAMLPARFLSFPGWWGLRLEFSFKSSGHHILWMPHHQIRQITLDRRPQTYSSYLARE